MGLVTDERHALSDALLAAGAEAPTLCEGWDVLDLAAHLVVRERRLDVAAGIVLPLLHGALGRATEKEKARGLEAVVARFREGPSRLSPYAWPKVGAAANLAEFVVHHEDVRRADGATGPREGVDRLQEAVWAQLGQIGLLALGRKRLPAVAVHADGRRKVLLRGDHPVVLTGEPVEILLRLFGRSDVAQVTVDGPSLSVTRFEQSPLGV